MSVKKLSLAELSAWVDRIIQHQRVVAPQARAGAFVYDTLASAADLRLDHDVTKLSPKKYFLPPREVLLEFTRGGDFTPSNDAAPLVVFGVHPYDVAAIAQADKYFSQDNPDSHYLARRAKATIVACDVQNPSANVFAGSMGTATVREGFDVLLTLVGASYLAQAATPAGRKLLELAGPLSDADAVSLGRREQVWQDAANMLRRHKLACPVSELPRLMEQADADHPIWEQNAGKCYSCGSCVMVCPSCFCFDVQDGVDWSLGDGKRTRQWDACLLSEFALVAGGHNFRKHRAERYRHRFYRKAKYLSDRCGFVACVGCGRCVSACTTGIANPVELYNVLLEGR
jgi:ferredoxin